MRTRSHPGLDASPDELEDLYGPYGQEVRGLDRLVGEGRVDLPEISLDPLDLLISAEEMEVEPDLDVSTLPERRVLTCFTPGYEPGGDPSDRVLPAALHAAYERRVRARLEDLRQLYSR